MWHDFKTKLLAGPSGVWAGHVPDECKVACAAHAPGAACICGRLPCRGRAHLPCYRGCTGAVLPGEGAGGYPAADTVPEARIAQCASTSCQMHNSYCRHFCSDVELSCRLLLRCASSSLEVSLCTPFHLLSAQLLGCTAEVPHSAYAVVCLLTPSASLPLALTAPA